MSARRSSLLVFVVAGLVVASLFAFFVSSHASSSPDGLEKVSQDKGFDGTATDHGLADGPLADYAVKGVDDPGLSTGLSGLVGVALCFGIAAGVTWVVRRRHDHHDDLAGAV